MWTLLILGQLEAHLHHTSEALGFLDRAIAHTPTCYDVYVEKAKILRRSGALREAAATLGIAWSLDKADRYMNTKYVKYLLRAGNVEEANRVVGYWTKPGVPPREDLFSIQACWFEVNAGEASLREGDVVHANKLFNNVTKHFDGYVVDQFDFHSYILRKSTIFAYLRFIHYVDRIYEHPYYIRAAIGALQCALRLSQQ